jgi:hypothetical protein
VSDEIELTLVSPADTHSFTVGDTYVMGRRGRVAGWFGVRYRVTMWAYSMTRWWRPRTVCSAIDREAGSITMAYETWSWRRWRWERT